MNVATVPAPLKLTVPATLFPPESTTVNDTVPGTTACENVADGATDTALPVDPWLGVTVVTAGGTAGVTAFDGDEQPVRTRLDRRHREGIASAVGQPGHRGRGSPASSGHRYRRLRGRADIRRHRIARDRAAPLLGAVQLTVADPLPAVAVHPVGAPGTVPDVVGVHHVYPVVRRLIGVRGECVRRPVGVDPAAPARSAARWSPPTPARSWCPRDVRYWRSRTPHTSSPR